MSTPIDFLVIDALNLVRRVYAGSPDDALGQTTQSIRRALRRGRPSHVVAVFDGTEPTFRHHLYPDYKAGRKPMPDDLRSRLELFRRAFEDLGVAAVERVDFEADDIAATLSTKAAGRGARTVILSTDRVYCQLLGAGISVRDHFNDIELDRGFVVDKFGVPPERLVDFWGLSGSSSTHIPGVPGIGPKTAARLIEAHGDLDSILEAAERGAIAGKTGSSLAEHSQLARLSRTLAALRCDLDLGWHLSSFRFAPPDGHR